jgi:hypothetical protein
MEITTTKVKKNFTALMYDAQLYEFLIWFI